MTKKKDVDWDDPDVGYRTLYKERPFWEEVQFKLKCLIPESSFWIDIFSTVAVVCIIGFAACLAWGIVWAIVTFI